MSGFAANRQGNVMAWVGSMNRRGAGVYLARDVRLLSVWLVLGDRMPYRRDRSVGSWTLRVRR